MYFLRSRHEQGMKKTSFSTIELAIQGRSASCWVVANAVTFSGA